MGFVQIDLAHTELRPCEYFRYRALSRAREDAELAGYVCVPLPDLRFRGKHRPCTGADVTSTVADHLSDSFLTLRCDINYVVLRIASGEIKYVNVLDILIVYRVGINELNGIAHPEKHILGSGEAGPGCAGVSIYTDGVNTVVFWP